jgi:transposase InsO family protein
MKTSLVSDTLRKALSIRKVNQWDLIFHSDRGSQYASHEFRKILFENKIISSMSKTGDCFDNACAESSFATIKKECVHRREGRTRQK